MKIYTIRRFCADRIDIITNLAVITNVIIKRVHLFKRLHIVPLGLGFIVARKTATILFFAHL